MSSTNAAGRKAGVLYLLTLILAPFNHIYIAGRFIVPGDAAATARNIRADELLYRVGVLSGLASEIVFLFLALSLYGLLKDVDRKNARLMLTLVAVGVAFGLVNLLNQSAPLILLNGSDFASAFTGPQVDALASAFLRLRTSGVYIAMAFWALWLFPFGALVIKSGFFPKLLGILLIIGGFAYLAVSATAILLPAQRQMVEQVTLPFYAVGELSMIIWLLVKGANPLSTDAARLSPNT
ncbi:MAG: DUF4386 domain-containing protein [Gemmatimonadales bacterium]